MFEIAVSVPAVFGDRSLLDGIRATAELNVDGIEFFDWENNDLDEIVAASDDAGVSIAATLSAGAGSTIEDCEVPALTDPIHADTAIEDIERSIDVCEAVDCPTLIVTVGPDQDGFDRSTQFESIVEGLSSVAPHAENAGVTIVVEPLNTRVDHPGYFLTSSQEAFDVVSTVDSPCVKVLFDIYHQQITEGDVTRRLTENVEHVGHVHIADNPGRAEPGTGELNYKNILYALDEADYEGYVGYEFMPNTDPAAAVRHVTRITEAISHD